MTTIDSISTSAPLTLKEFGYRALGMALMAGGLALARLGLASRSTHVAPAPAPQGSLCFDSHGMMTWCDDY